MKKLTRNKLWKLLLPASALALLVCASSASASLVTETAGGTATFSASSGNAAGMGLGGGTVINSGGSPTANAYTFGSGGVDTGTLTTYVVQGDANNTLGGLTFIYALDITGGDVSSLEVTAGWGSSVELGYGTGGAQPLGGTYTTSGSVNFTLFPPATTGTFYLIVGTAQPNYGPAGATIIDSLPDAAQPTLAPVPEPSTVVAGLLMLLPLGAGAFRALRKERTV